MLLKAIPSTQQRRALDTGVSVWLSANAGTGKTQVLTGRMIRLMLEGAAPERVLALTFTNAAAAEMADRIRREVAGWAMLNDADLKKGLEAFLQKEVAPAMIARARQMFTLVVDRPGNVRILTIHGFCQQLLGGFCLEAGLSPGFVVMDDAATEECRREAFHELLADEEIGRDAEQGLGELACLAGDKGLHEILAAIQNERDAFEIALAGGVEAAITKTRIALSVEQGWTQESLLTEMAAVTSEPLQQLAEQLANVATSDNDRDRVRRDVAAAIIEWQRASPVERIRNSEKYLNAFFSKDGEGDARSLPWLFVKAFTAEFPELVEAYASEQARLILIRENLWAFAAYRRMAALLPVAEAFLQHYEARKKRLNLLDFDDLIATSLKLLRQSDIAPWIRYKLDGGVEHILVDEAQDTNAEQWAIIEALCDEFFVGQGASSIERTLFVVGDPKQSIFSFQGASPQEYARVRDMLAARADGAKKPWSPEQLDTSYRSTESVLRLVDAVCASMGTEMMAQHEVHRIPAAGRVELWPIALPDTKEEKESTGWLLPTERLQKDDPQRKVVDAVVSTISKWMREKRMLEAKGRPVEPGDILILVRRRSRLMERLVRSLKRSGIAVAGVDRLELLDHILVQDLVQLGRFLLLPQDDLALAIVLKTPFVGISEEQLFRLAHERGEESLWKRLTASEECRAACERLRGFLRVADYMTPFELYSHILEARGGREQAVTRMGEGVQDVLNIFLNQALAYQQEHPPSLQGFLDWLEAQGTEIKRNPELSGNQVRIMTVHGAKGLQAPIVFIPDAACSPKRNSRQQLLWDEVEQLPFWPQGPSPKYGEALKEKRKQQETEEEKRLLYVALTRAADELYVAGWKDKDSKSKKPQDGDKLHTYWYEQVEKAMQGAKECEAPAKLDGTAKYFANPQREKAETERTAEASSKTQILPQALRVHPHKEDVIKTLAITTLASENITHVKSASKAVEDVAERGVWIHRLLELLPGVEENARVERARRYLASQAAVLPEAIRHELADEAVKLLSAKELAPYFDSATSLAEVPVKGDVKGVPVVGRIDRLCVFNDHVAVIDFKTSLQRPQTVESVPEAYRHQMAHYEALLAPLFPGKPIRSALLYTRDARLVWLS